MEAQNASNAFQDDLLRAREVAMTAVRAGGCLLREELNNHHSIRAKKTAIDLVTTVDQRVETLIISILRQSFPNYGYQTEESPTIAGTKDYCWIIDPLDGTTNYIHRYPLFAVSLALAWKDTVVLGVVYNPLADELFVAVKDHGATLNDRPIHVSDTATLAPSLLASGFPYDVWEREDDNTAEWRSLLKRVTSLRSDGSAALDLCHVACGRLDGYWEFGLEPWDIAAGSLIVQEAGGQVTDRDGAPFSVSTHSVVASNGVLHLELLQALQRAHA